MPCKVSAEELSSSVPVLRQGEEEVAACEDVKKAKDACLAEVSTYLSFKIYFSG